MSFNNKNKKYPASSEILHLPTNQLFPFLSKGKFFSSLTRHSVVMPFIIKSIYTIMSLFSFKFLKYLASFYFYYEGCHIVYNIL